MPGAGCPQCRAKYSNSDGPDLTAFLFDDSQWFNGASFDPSLLVIGDEFMVMLTLNDDSTHNTIS